MDDKIMTFKSGTRTATVYNTAAGLKITNVKTPKEALAAIKVGHVACFHCCDDCSRKGVQSVISLLKKCKKYKSMSNGILIEKTSVAMACEVVVAAPAKKDIKPSFDFDKLDKYLDLIKGYITNITQSPKKNKLKDISKVLSIAEKMLNYFRRSKIDEKKAFIQLSKEFILTIERLDDSISLETSVSNIRKFLSEFVDAYSEIAKLAKDVRLNERVPDIRKKLVKPEPGTPWKEQLEDVKTHMLGKRRRKKMTKEKQLYPETYYEEQGEYPFDTKRVLAPKEERFIRQTLQTKKRLLKKEEEFGFLEAPIIISQYMINDKGMEALREMGIHMDRVFGHYLKWENAPLIGVSISVVEKMLSIKKRPITDAVYDIHSYINKHRKERRVILGPIKRIGSHIYWIALPSSFNDRHIAVDEWDVLGK